MYLFSFNYTLNGGVLELMINRIEYVKKMTADND